MDIVAFVLKMEKERRGKLFYRELAQNTRNKNIAAVPAILTDEEKKHQLRRVLKIRSEKRIRGFVQGNGSMKNRKKGFTLIELLVVIAIIALLLSIIVPSLKAAKNLAKDAVCLSNLGQIGKAVQTYAFENDHLIPRNAGGAVCWVIAFAPYLGQPIKSKDEYLKMDIYNCPKYPDPLQTIDYVLTNWNSSPSGGQIIGPNKITLYKSLSVKLYMGDHASVEYVDNNGASRIRNRPIITTIQDLKDKSNFLDVWNPSHLPSSDDLGTIRVAEDRHKKIGCNNMFLDGHAGWINRKENTYQYWYLK